MSEGPVRQRRHHRAIIVLVLDCLRIYRAGHIRVHSVVPTAEKTFWSNQKVGRPGPMPLYVHIFSHIRGGTFVQTLYIKDVACKNTGSHTGY